MKRRKLIRLKSTLVYDRKQLSSKTTLWKQFKLYIDNIEIGKKFTRKNMLSTIYGLSESTLHLHNKKMTTIDTYRSILTKCEIIEMSEKPGVYIKVKNLPDNIKYQDLVKAAYDTTWKKWFMPLEDLLKTYGGRGEEA